MCLFLRCGENIQQKGKIWYLEQDIQHWRFTRAEQGRRATAYPRNPLKLSVMTLHYCRQK